MHYDQLVTDFCEDIVGLIREEALNALTASHKPPQRVAKPRKVTKKTPPPAPVVKQYMPNVSPDIVSDVEGLLMLDVGMTSHEIADSLIRGETTVRVALKHLVQQGKCRVQLVGRSSHYFSTGASKAAGPA